MTELTLNRSTQAVYAQTGATNHGIYSSSVVAPPLQVTDVIPSTMDRMCPEKETSTGASANVTDVMLRSRVSHSQGLYPIMCEGVDPVWRELILNRRQLLNDDCELQLAWSGIRGERCQFFPRGMDGEGEIASTKTSRAFKYDQAATILACIVNPGWCHILIDRVHQETIDYYGLGEPKMMKAALRLAKPTLPLAEADVTGYDADFEEHSPDLNLNLVQSDYYESEDEELERAFRLQKRVSEEVESIPKNVGLS